MMPAQATPMLAFAICDELRRMQGKALDAFGLGPDECAYHVVSSGPHWRLREYTAAGAAPPLLIVPAPIKRPYIWDLAPSASAVRTCLNQGLRVYLLEWTPPSAGDEPAGLDEYAAEAIGACAAQVANAGRGVRPFLVGHSLGGTLAAIFCALEPRSARGLALLGAPLCFEPGTSRFRDSLVAHVPSTLFEADIVAGSLLTQVCAAASPDTFLWPRWRDAALSLADPFALDIHARVERWTLDEMALPGKLVSQIFQWLYHENRLCRGTLSVRGETVGPSSLRVPTLAVVSAADEISPLASVARFIEQMPIDAASIIEYGGEAGVGLPHLGMLVGRQAYARIWPQIITWMKAGCEG